MWPVHMMNQAKGGLIGATMCLMESLIRKTPIFFISQVRDGTSFSKLNLMIELTEHNKKI